MVTVTVSIDCLPLPVVMTNWPHCAIFPPYCAYCCIVQFGTPLGASTVMDVSLQVSIAAATPPMVTEDRELQVVLPVVGLEH
jgi:hypothetical protein